MPEYQTTMRSEYDVIITRCENGWLIRTNDNLRSGFTPLKVAHDVPMLLGLVEEWGKAQEAGAAK